MNLQERLESYQNEQVVLRYAKEHRVSVKEAHRCFDDMKQFLYRSAVAGRALRPTPRVDGMWHTFILFTRDYAQFNHNVLGTFIHHIPDGPGPGPDSQEPQEESFLDRLMRPLAFLRTRPHLAVARAACTSDQAGSQDNGGGGCSSQGGG